MSNTSPHQKSTTAIIKRKKRVLSSKEPVTSPARQLRQRTASPANEDEQIEKPSPKRSILTLQQKSETAKKTSRRKRKLNSNTSLLIDSSDEDPASKYLEEMPKPVVILGTPSKQRKKLKQETPVLREEQPNPLDLSQHSILPNDSYVAHLPKKMSHSQSEEEDGASINMFYDAPSEFDQADKDVEQMNIVEQMSDVEQVNTVEQIHNIEEVNNVEVNSAKVDNMEVDDNDVDSFERNKEEPASTKSFWSSLFKPFFKQ